MNEHSKTAAGQQESIDSKLTQLLTEFRSQKAGLHALNAEVRANSQSVASEVKKLETDTEFQWQYDGNKIQYQFNANI